MNKRIQIQNVLCTRLTEKQLSIIQRDWKSFYDEPNKFIGSSTIDCIHEYIGTVKCNWWTNEYGWKLSQLEGVLRTELSRENVEHIKVFWRAFYESPWDFTNDKIIGLICQDLGLEYDDKELCSMKNIFKETPSLTNLHYTITGDAVWGKCRGVHFYAKKCEYDYHKANYESCTIDELKSKTKSKSLFVLHFKNDVTGHGIHLVFNSEDLNGTCGITEFDFLIGGYNYLGMYVVNDTTAPKMMKHVANIYIPFAKGANDSRIPIIWLNTAETTSLSLSTNYECDFDVDWFTGGFNKDKFYKFCQSIVEVLPSVDLENRPDDRYATIELINLFGTIAVYNRNHKAYHGNVTRIREFSPIFLMTMATCVNAKSIEGCNIMDILLDDTLDESVLNIDKINEDKKPVVEESCHNKNITLVKEDNILMRAAMASDTSVNVTN